MTHTIDATNQSVGRLASKIAVLIRGKDRPGFEPRIISDDHVVITNIKKLKFTGNKLEQKIYYHYSGFPGGMKARSMETVFQKDPAWILRHAVLNMLPQNRQRSRLIKNLEIKD